MWYAAYTGQTGSHGALAQCWHSIGTKRAATRLAVLATLPVALDPHPGHLAAAEDLLLAHRRDVVLRIARRDAGASSRCTWRGRSPCPTGGCSPRVVAVRASRRACCASAPAMDRLELALGVDLVLGVTLLGWPPARPSAPSAPPRAASPRRCRGRAGGGCPRSLASFRYPPVFRTLHPGREVRDELARGGAPSRSSAFTPAALGESAVARCARSRAASRRRRPGCRDRRRPAPRWSRGAR